MESSELTSFQVNFPNYSHFLEQAWLYIAVVLSAVLTAGFILFCIIGIYVLYKSTIEELKKF